MAVSRSNPTGPRSTNNHRSDEEEGKHDKPATAACPPESPSNLFSSTPSSNTKPTNEGRRPHNKLTIKEVTETPNCPFRNPFFGGRLSNLTPLKLSKTTSDSGGQSLRNHESGGRRNDSTTVEGKIEQDVGNQGHTQDTDLEDNQIKPPPAPRPQYATLPEIPVSAEFESEYESEDDDEQLAKMKQAHDALLTLSADESMPSSHIEPKFNEDVLPQDVMNAINKLTEIPWSRPSTGSTDTAGDDETMEVTSEDNSRRTWYESGRDERARFSTVPEDIVLFGRFTKLPEHIRQKIWSLSYSRRLVEVLEQDGEFIARRLHKNKIINLAVCQESRSQALIDYPLSFSVDSDPPLIRFNFDLDTLFLGVGLQNNESYKFFRAKCDAKDLARLKNLAVDAALTWGRNMWHDPGKQHTRYGNGLCGLLKNIYPNLQIHIVVYTGYTDPIPWWAQESWFPLLPCKADHRYAQTDARTVYQFYAENWNDIDHYTSLFRLSTRRTPLLRYGGVPPIVKWEPALKRWKVPYVYVIGIPDRSIYGKAEHVCLEEMIMDKVIDNIFD
ncbi:hypothetical protein GLAREA_06223 [Glarea lozoyensis ATCC 20868]|uniref:2EXR domain-containing protein n=1 Tax=Glarea lozoyensis (strain ATCC 20868 / MF5171) TaxID=1116229 RepID=S3DMA1_GLAL2|nr:uncharacterized protein GLAREA_06223 [Glarea lozoyensis ATCC 20868]EPE33211.1 hypothetical protein GLAREA_06223 [Glarea lozoyensis ATCC 20868]